MAAVFLMSGVTKLAAPRQFVRDVVNYRILPRPLARAFGWALPYVELGTALLLFSGWQARWAALAALLLLASFMVAMGIAMVRGQNLHCSCFGLLYRERIGWGTQARDGVLALLALAVALADDGSLAIVRLARELPSAPSVAALLLTGMALAASLALSYASIRGAGQARRAPQPAPVPPAPAAATEAAAPD